jgi:predicted negative regulator of RcsB-dependent stress response
MSLSLNKVGDVLLAAGDQAGARVTYEESLAIMRKLAAADPGNAEWQRDLSVSLGKVGDVLLAAGDHAGALSAYDESLGVRRKLVAADPGNAQWQRDLSVSFERVGDALLEAGDRAGALAHLARARCARRCRWRHRPRRNDGLDRALRPGLRGWRLGVSGLRGGGQQHRANEARPA